MIDKPDAGAGCGRPVIKAYLGNGDPNKCPYPEWMIKEAVATLKMMAEPPKIAEKVIATNELSLARSTVGRIKKALEAGDTYTRAMCTVSVLPHQLAN